VLLCRIIVKGTDKVFDLKAETDEEAGEWIAAIQTHIEESEGYKKDLST
jgi:hypothetical protein